MRRIRCLRTAYFSDNRREYPFMKAILLLLIAIALVMTAQMREKSAPDAINPTDELIDRELTENEQREQTKSPPHE